jgi:putative ABC transport system substrate-binding protein
MRRREFLSGIVGITASSRGAWAQPARRRVGVLMPHPVTQADSKAGVDALRQELQKLGWIENRSISIDERWTGGGNDEVRRLAKELVALNPDVIFVRSTPATAILRQETKSIPIVFVAVSDPVGDGFVASLSRPGGNTTGFTNVEASLAGKWVELLKEMAPETKRIGVLFGPKTSPGGGTYYLRLIEKAGASMGTAVVPLPINDPTEISPALAGFAQTQNSGLIVTPDTQTSIHYKQLIDAIAVHRLPTMYWGAFFVSGGGLIAYGTDVIDQHRRAAGYLDRILKGEKAADLPVQAPSKYELTVNMKAAKALGLTVPLFLQQRADEVIE